MTGGLIVIGVGNPRRRDGGVGPAVVRLLRKREMPGVALATSLGETDELIDLWDGAEFAIVVDAVRAWPVHPGRVHRLTVPKSGGERARAASSHGIDLGEAVELARELDRLPGRLVLYGVEAVDLGHGVGLTPAVRDAAERLADEIAVVARAARGAAPVLDERRRRIRPAMAATGRQVPPGGVKRPCRALDTTGMLDR